MAMRPYVRASLLATTLALAGGALVPAARADDPVAMRLETLVPGKTLAFAGVEDIGTWDARWKQTALAKLFAQPDMAAFSGPIGEDLKKMLEGGDGKDETPIPPMVREVFHQVQGLSGQAAVALVSMPDGGRRPPVIAANLDFGSNLQDFVTFLKRMKERDEEMPLRTEEKDGRPWWSMGRPEHPDMVGTTVGTSVVVSTDQAWLDAVVASKGAPAADALASNGAFTRARGAAGDGTALFVFGNVPALLDRFMPDAPPETGRIVKALGGDTVRGIAYGFGFRGEVFRETFVIDAPANADHGVFSLLRGAPITRKGLAMAPATAFAFSESSMPLSRLLPTLRPVLAEIDAGIPAKIDRAMADAKAATGVDLERDLLPLLADDLSYYLAMPETGGLYPELAVSLGVKDADAFEKTAQKAVDGLLQTLGKDEHVQGKQRVIEWHGKRLYVIELAGVRRRDMVPFTPTWAVLDGRWVLTLVPHAMKELILRMEQGGKGLADQEDVVAILRNAPENATGLGYIDLQALLTLVYDTAVPVLQTMAKPNLLPTPVRLDWAMLPPTREVRPFLRSMGTHSFVQGDLFVAYMDSPVGYLLPMVAAVGVGTMAMTSRRHAQFEREFVARDAAGNDSRVMVADLQAQSLAEAVRAYRAAQGKLPSTLAQLGQETNPASGRPWLERLPRDPWGVPYAYTVKDADKGEFEIRSSGPDRIPNTLDDVVHPTPSDR